MWSTGPNGDEMISDVVASSDHTFNATTRAHNAVNPIKKNPVGTNCQTILISPQVKNDIT